MRAQPFRTAGVRRAPRSPRSGPVALALKTLALKSFGSALAVLFGAAAGAEPMQGFPPAPEDQVTLGNWNAEPYIRWTSRNLSILPSVMVPRAGGIRELPRAADPGIEDMTFEYGGRRSTVRDALADDATDGFLVLRDGAIVYERYFGDFGERHHHLWASSTKSLVAMTLGILVEEGRVDPDSPVVEYLPELAGSGFERTTLRHLLNMTSAIDYTEDYGERDPAHTSVQYFRRMGFFPAPDLVALDPRSDPTPRAILRFLPSIAPRQGLSPGERYDYQSPNVDVIGWIISRVTDQPLNEVVAERVWAHLGVEHDAYFATDHEFVPIATGGFASTLRDAARFGLAILEHGRSGGAAVFPSAWIEDTLAVTPADLAAAERSIYRQRDHPAFDHELSAYRNFWWILDAERGELTTRGVYGQYVYVNRDANVVIATFASSTPASNARRESFKRKMRATRAIADQLASKRAQQPGGRR